ncbi:hypothetical protein [Nitrospira moscoviensis]|uniref:DUF5666 domain-containing protein n=1 Tax=Nitrospira moscoviensis TaxID=42253 RepID=A0A0K2GBQ3_NITMO|nr:hypothetical protein [Nitrospira moscoviensis]ALA58299.1 exported protein of unknown function [Nitrospira moscoviensis]
MADNKFLMAALLIGAVLAAPLLAATDAYADHVQLNGMVAKIQSDVVFAKTPWGMRIIGTKKQLGDLGVGDRVTILVNEDNSVVDVHKEGAPAPRHTVLNGHLLASTPVKNEIRLWTAEGKKVLPVSTTAIARFNAIPVGSPITVELNERGQIIDVRKMIVAVDRHA